MRDDNCIFCKIANGEIPSATVYEDDDFRAILDLGPASKGHTLILPKNHYKDLCEADETVMAKILPLAAKLGKSIQIDFKANAEAFQAMKAVQMDRHDAILLDMAKDISGYDCVVLAQASMAHLDQKIEAICKIPVLSSPGLCMEQVKETLKTI